MAGGDDEHRHAIGAGVASGLAVLVVLIRILAVAGYDWHVAFAITHTVDLEDLPALMLGTFMGDQLLAGALLALVLPFVALAWWGRGRRPDAGLVVLVALAVIAISLTASTGSWWVPATALAIGGLAALVGGLDGDRPGGRLVRGLVARAGLLAVVALLLAAAVSRTPWVPKERIETTRGPIVGWVLATDPGFLKVLEADERRLLIVPDGEVRSREELEH
ncbi:hypothetical protein [Patulibacter defluvii]|uniref:hypothetical protein n=1 Tax=Patulibacter defluvii TaxID=3095358 RepID=UPI002A7573E2|nr:hypothetical protein [Patulibacter sp. DM4]